MQHVGTYRAADGPSSGRETSRDAWRDSYDIAQRHSAEQEKQASLVCLFCRRSDLYRSCLLAAYGIVSSRMDLFVQCACGVFLCLESLGARSTTQRWGLTVRDRRLSHRVLLATRSPSELSCGLWPDLGAGTVTHRSVSQLLKRR